MLLRRPRPDRVIDALRAPGDGLQSGQEHRRFDAADRAADPAEQWGMRWLAFLFAGIAGACLAGDSAEEQPESSFGEGALWTVSEVPAMLAGGPGSDIEFGNVVGAVRFVDGNVAVADGHNVALVLLDSDGNVLRRVGDRGAGPGEFQDLYWVQHFRGDSLIAWDDVLVRGTVYDSSLRIGRVISLPEEARGSLTIPFGFLNDASIIALQGFPRIVAIGGEAWEQMEAVRISTVEKRTHELVTLNTKRCRQVDMTSCPYPDFGNASYFGTSSDALVVADAAVPEIALYDGSGAKRWSVIPEEPRRRLTAADRADIQGRGYADALPIPDRVPPFLDLRVGGGVIWVKVDTDNTWQILDLTGEQVGRARLPSRFKPLDVAPEWVTGVTEDGLGVTSLQVYKLQATSSFSAPGAMGPSGASQLP